MTRIHVLGGTGYAGRHVVAEAAARGHQVTSYSRSAPKESVPGVDYVAAPVQEDATLEAVVRDADVLVVALAPRGELEGRVRGVVADLADRAESARVRLGVLGGAGSLHVSPGGPLLSSLPDFPAEIRPEAEEMGQVLDDLRRDRRELDWFYVSPSPGFGPWAEGQHTGRFRIGDDVVLNDENGESTISGADYAHAIVDEIDTPTHRRTRFTVGY